MQKFTVSQEACRDGNYTIELINDGRVSCMQVEYTGTDYWNPERNFWIDACSLDDKPNGLISNPYGFFTRALDKVAVKCPEVYRAVYEHIQVRTEADYKRLAEYCKKKNNEYACKLQIIE